MSISLKALVDKHKNKVVFVESDNDFVEVLFSFLTIPMGTITRLSCSKSKTVGTSCMYNLYESVKNIDVQLFRAKECKEMLLCPRRATEVLGHYLQCNSYGVAKRYLCCNEVYDFGSGLKCDVCKCGAYIYSRIELSSEPSSTPEDGDMFTKGNTRFVISDDLQIVSLSNGASLSLFSNLGVTDWSSVEERILEIQLVEVWDLLLCSLFSRTPLTETLLKHKPVPGITAGLRDVEKQARKGNIKQEGKFTVKLMVSKSKKIVCYAEAKEDFVNLLLSFLAVPVGHILKHRLNGFLNGCVDNLYKSVVELDEKCFKSKSHEKMLVSPMLALGFGYENDLISIEQASRPLFYSQLDNIGALLLYNDEDLHSKIASKAPGFSTVMDFNTGRDGFLKRHTMFTLTDSLIIRPISPLFVISILNELKVPFSDIEVKVVRVGKEEVRRLSYINIKTGQFEF
ncbi:hypothetical protein FEM48_Zijuj02G0060500 [Ziziphus jujuba var. spinosa]|uniref:DUF674 family protein n=1 Tax=Ziziphus jujuba var. spinosa TaxID=714518 RepID=A0A978VU19_ZIZJJ|nr:hypothetical protein FEM48_Zijuj02G0060500 [Ziziphus jujuba var. spinosa]